MSKHPVPANIAKLKAKMHAIVAPNPSAFPPSKKFTRKELLAKYAGIAGKVINAKTGETVLADVPTYKKPENRRTKPGSFTETERAILLRGVVDALDERGAEFSVWRKYGLSRVYFADGSWLGYSPAGVAIYGPDKEGEAYRWREALGLKVMAKRAVVL